MLTRPHRGMLPAVGLAVLWLCADTAQAASAPEAHMLITDFMFSPLTLTIQVGVEVTWVNQDDEPHTVVSDSGLFRSSALDTGEAYAFRFDKPGTYRLLCSMHPQMVAIIIVE